MHEVDTHLARWDIGLAGIRLVDLDARTARLVWTWSDYDSAVRRGTNVRLEETSYRDAKAAGGLATFALDPESGPVDHVLGSEGIRSYATVIIEGDGQTVMVTMGSRRLDAFESASPELLRRVSVALWERSQREPSLEAAIPQWRANFLAGVMRFGAFATQLVVSIIALYLLLPGSPSENRGALAALLATAAIGTSVLLLIPWRRIARTPWALRVLVAWSIGDIALITAGVAVSGGPTSDLWPCYVFVVIVAAGAYPVALQAWILVAAGSAYTATYVLGDGGTPAELLWHLGTLAVASYIGGHFGLSLLRLAEANDRSRKLAEARSHVVAATARASSRFLSNRDIEGMLGEVLESALFLTGSEAGYVSRLGDDTYEISLSIGLPHSITSLSYSFDEGITPEVARTRSTITAVEGGPTRLLAGIREAGFRSVTASPIWDGDRVTGALVVAGRTAEAPDSSTVEVADLLGRLASVGLQNARRFDAERRSRQALEQANRAKDDFLATVSHELRTPLTVLVGSLSTVLDRPVDAGLARDLLLSALRNARELDTLIARLLDYVSLSQNPSPDWSAVDVRAIARDVGAAVEIRAGAPVRVLLDGDARVAGNWKTLHDAIEAVVENAVMHGGQSALVSVRPGEREVEIVVEDDGPGVPEADRERVFEPFWRGGDVLTRGTRGAGIGLTMAREVAMLHGGRIWVDGSRLGGAAVHLTIPAA